MPDADHQIRPRAETSARRPIVAVVDYGVNNVGSVVNMLRRLDMNAVTARSPEELEPAQAIVLPGIGAFDTGVFNLKRRGLFDAIKNRCSRGKTPVLGICLGMQLLGLGSEEGTMAGLGLVDAYSRRFAFENELRHLKVPHMGWNEVTAVDGELFDGDAQHAPRFYFVHSYHVICAEEGDVAARARYGHSFVAAIRRQHVMGTQFHPEKSHAFGMKVLRNFARIAGVVDA